MKGISGATILAMGLGLLLLTPAADAKGKQSAFKVRSPRAAALVDHNTRTLPRSPKRQGHNPAVGAPPEDVSPEAAEVVYLYHHGFSSDELLHYVNKSHADFKLTVSDVNYLEDIGIGTEVVVAMIRPAEARENVARLRQRLPGWASEALFGEKKAQQTPVIPEGTDTLDDHPTIPWDQHGNPNYYGPTYHQPVRPLPYGYPYNVPSDRYRDYPGYGPFYDPYGGRTWYP